ncbi:Phospho-n-acetylmuramoyl-pentapeptide-transferase-like protein [Thalictrum thalictroides]|uniref:Phospho-n-acetylmuramoyl-pentapeptide-transferase-like protein n=1 Tax=Thalictrum thalictroides TaxID=46969 RepID=A0A7J6WFI5_THATH|nr:Phospho-n-acetylmuramoyl-pentapeptide-transferase-like protein [Thalictrum thalictroides]
MDFLPLMNGGIVMESSDTEVVVNPIGDVDLPSTNERFESSDGALAVTAHRFSMLRRRHATNRIQPGNIINMGLIAFLVMILLFVDWCSWRIVRLPLASFYLSRPFSISAVLALIAGWLCIPLFKKFKIYQNIRKKGPRNHYLKEGTPTMGGLFFIPIGITVAGYIAGFSSVEVLGAAAATLAFAAIGLLDDTFSVINKRNFGLPAWIKLMLEVAVGLGFTFWLNSANISSPYSMKTLVPLPAPFGLVHLGKLYVCLTSFCFVSMGNGINLTDGLDGLAGGTAALAFIGMSIAVLPICSELSIFGVSMAGACIGFLAHNRYKASIFMGDTGSLALGGALAAMAACTGMFFPLFISSGIFVIEVLSVLLQVSYFKTTKRLNGVGSRFFRMAPLHHHLELCGLKEPHIVASTYVVSCILAVYAGYVGLISA